MRAADFLAAFNTLAVSVCCSLRFSLSSFSEPSRRRFSSGWILFFNFFGFMVVLLLSPKGDQRLGDLMTKSRRCHVPSLDEYHLAPMTTPSPEDPTNLTATITL